MPETTCAIWKFPLQAMPATTVVQMPRGARVLSAGVQGFSFVLWALVDPGAEREERTFRLVGTGWEIADFDRLIHVATFTQDAPPHGQFVWHVFERLTPPPSEPAT